MIVETFYEVPENSIITNGLVGDVHYIDSFMIRIKKPEDITVDFLTAMIFTSNPAWMRYLVRIRDLMVKPFGLETGLIPEIKDFEKSIHFHKGQRAIFFTVSHRSENEIVMEEDDKHLLFRTSVLMEKGANGMYNVYSTTLVQFHNLLGRAYFLPVKPFHKLIVKSFLKRSKRKLLKMEGMDRKNE